MNHMSHSNNTGSAGSILRNYFFHDNGSVKQFPLAVWSFIAVAEAFYWMGML